jgi:hypothetical protein
MSIVTGACMNQTVEAFEVHDIRFPTPSSSTVPTP